MYGGGGGGGGDLQFPMVAHLVGGTQTEDDSPCEVSRNFIFVFSFLFILFVLILFL